MKTIILIMMGILLMVSMTNLIDAEIKYNQFKLIDRNPSINPNDTLRNTTTIFATVEYNKGQEDDFIKGDNPLEFYVAFSITVETWNNANPDFSVEFCNFTTRTFPLGIGVNESFVFNQVFTDDNTNDKHFVQLNDGDFWTLAVDCKFNSTRTSIQIPANIQIVTPTQECKACQFFENALLERDIAKAEAVGNNIVQVSNIINKFIALNFEIIIALFFVILIIIAVHSTGLIFIGLIWMLGYLKDITR